MQTEEEKKKKETDRKKKEEKEKRLAQEIEDIDRAGVDEKKNAVRVLSPEGEQDEKSVPRFITPEVIEAGEGIADPPSIPVLSMHDVISIRKFDITEDG